MPVFANFLSSTKENTITKKIILSSWLNYSIFLNSALVLSYTFSIENRLFQEFLPQFCLIYYSLSQFCSIKWWKIIHRASVFCPLNFDLKGVHDFYIGVLPIWPVRWLLIGLKSETGTPWIILSHISHQRQVTENTIIAMFPKTLFS